ASDDRDIKAYFTNLVRPGKQHLTETAAAVIREFDLHEVLHLRPDELSFGQRRLVGLARTIAGQPSVLLLDEPASGLSSGEVAELGVLVRRLAETWGLAVLVIEHNVGFVLETCDRVVALDYGRQIAAGTPEEIVNNPVVIQSYLGEACTDDRPVRT